MYVLLNMGIFQPAMLVLAEGTLTHFGTYWIKHFVFFNLTRPADPFWKGHQPKTRKHHLPNKHPKKRHMFPDFLGVAFITWDFNIFSHKNWSHLTQTASVKSPDVCSFGWWDAWRSAKTEPQDGRGRSSGRCVHRDKWDGFILPWKTNGCPLKMVNGWVGRCIYSLLK